MLFYSQTLTSSSLSLSSNTADDPQYLHPRRVPPAPIHTAVTPHHRQSVTGLVSTEPPVPHRFSHPHHHRGLIESVTGAGKILLFSQSLILLGSFWYEYEPTKIIISYIFELLWFCCSWVFYFVMVFMLWFLLLLWGILYCGGFHVVVVFAAVVGYFILWRFLYCCGLCCCCGVFYFVVVFILLWGILFCGCFYIVVVYHLLCLLFLFQMGRAKRVANQVTASQPQQPSSPPSTSPPPTAPPA